VRRSTTVSSFRWGITIQRVDDPSRAALDSLGRLASARRALEVERAMTTPTVSAPISSWRYPAITGAAAGAGPPPSPAVMTNMSATFSA